MTTIAARILGNGALEIASDRQATGDRIEKLMSPKVIRYGDFYLGACGALTFMNRIQGLDHSDWPEVVSDRSVNDQVVRKVRSVWRDVREDVGEDSQFSILIASRAGLWVIDSDMSVVRSERFTSIGSGSQFALGALSAGAGVLDSVEIAREYDIYTGGEIDYFLLS